MNYNSGVCFFFCNDKHGNALQMRVLRYYLAVHCNAPILAIIGEFGLVTLQLQHYYCKFWKHIKKLEEVRLPKMVTKLQKTLLYSSIVI